LNTSTTLVDAEAIHVTADVGSNPPAAVNVIVIPGRRSKLGAACVAVPPAKFSHTGFVAVAATWKLSLVVALDAARMMLDEVPHVPVVWVGGPELVAGGTVFTLPITFEPAGNAPFSSTSNGFTFEDMLVPLVPSTPTLPVIEDVPISTSGIPETSVCHHEYEFV
jgi:hypothetical protein